MDNLDNVLAQFAFKRPPKNTPARQSNNKSQLPPSSSNKSSDKPDPLTFPTKKVKTSTKDSSNPMLVESEPNLPVPASSTRKKVLKKETIQNDQQFDITKVIEAPQDNPEDSKGFIQEEKKNKGKKPQNAQSNNKKKGGISAATKPELGVEYDPDNTPQGIDSVKLPDWAVEPNIRDKNGKHPDEEGYDPTTLYIPPNALDKMGTMLKKYWEVKSQYYDAVVLIRLHLFYYVYHRDAYICHIECGAKIFGQTGSTTAYLHPPSIQKHCQKLLDKNYRIILIEPTQDYQDKDDAKLEIYQIITKGTSLEPNLEKFTSRYCLILTPKGSNYGFTYFDTTTHEFFMGEFQDTPNNTQLRSLLLTITPVEIVYRDKTLSKELIILLKGLYWKPILTTLPSTAPCGIEPILYRIKCYLEIGQKSQEASCSHIKVLENLIEKTEDYLQSMENEGKVLTETDCPNYWTFQGVYLSFEYLEYLHLLEIVFRKCRFSLHDLKQKNTKNLILDGQTVNNLELLDVPYLGNATSLFSFMDKTRSAYGKRMFKKWLLEPLRDVERINERLDAVEDLMLDDELTGTLQDKLARLGDVERVIHSIYNFGNRNNIFHELDFDSYVKSKIHSFVEALDQLKRANALIQFFSPYLQRFRSKRLIQLFGFRGEKPITHKKTQELVEGIFPVYTETLSKLESMMVIKEGIPVPAPGMDSGYDELVKEISGVKQEFQAILERTRKRFNCQGITYVHIKQRYELEIPEHLVEGTKKPKEYTFTSKKKGYARFHTQEILDLIQKIEEMELRLHKVILPFIVKCFKEFYSHNTIWHEVIQCLGELDCLASLAQLAKTMPLSCRPSFTKGQIFNLRGVVHPLVAMRSAEFISNDVELEEGQKVFLITGPNMGGKSTLMRSVCIATIMAQMGSFVAAESFNLSLKDRIFTRIGANDNIFEGKSTFFVELEETLNIITEATEESLVIIDELGRGTSTYDGMAIAYAVLKDLADNIGCLCFFATHFHLLLEDFKLFKTVIMYYMDSEFFEDELVRFLYKFKKGSVGNSFGLSVARFAGLPLSVVEKARKRAADMTKELVSVQQFKEITGKFSEIITALENEKSDIDDLIDKLANL